MPLWTVKGRTIGSVRSSLAKPDNTILACEFWRVSALHFMTFWKEILVVPPGNTTLPNRLADFYATLHDVLERTFACIFWRVSASHFVRHWKEWWCRHDNGVQLLTHVSVLLHDASEGNFNEVSVTLLVSNMARQSDRQQVSC